MRDNERQSHARRLTQEESERILGVLEANGGAVRQTARETGVSAPTVVAIRDRSRKAAGLTVERQKPVDYAAAWSRRELAALSYHTAAPLKRERWPHINSSGRGIGSR